MDEAEVTMGALADDDNGVSVGEELGRGTIESFGERMREPTTRS